MLKVHFTTEIEYIFRREFISGALRFKNYYLNIKTKNKSYKILLSGEEQ